MRKNQLNRQRRLGRAVVDVLEVRRLMSRVTSSALNITGPNTAAPHDQWMDVTFDDSVSANLLAKHLALLNLSTGTSVEPSRLATSEWGGGFKSKVLWSDPALANTEFVLPDGNYEFSIAAEEGPDVGMPSLEDDHRSLFHILAGDFNRDRNVNFADLTILSQNYNGTGKSFSQGDANFDGVVNFTDLVALSQRYNTLLQSPPTQPGQLRLGGATSTTMTVDWSAVADVDYYRILRSTDGVNFRIVADAIPVDQTSFTDVELDEGRKYWYQVRSYQGDAEAGTGSLSESSNKVSGTTVLDAPTDLRGVLANANQLMLSWTPQSTSQTGYRVYRQKAGAAPTLATTFGNASGPHAISVEPGDVRFFVQALNATAESGFSQPIDLTLPVPGSLGATVTDELAVDLAWSNVSDEVGYEVQRSDDGTTWTRLTSTDEDVTSISDNDIDGGGTYQYRVRSLHDDAYALFGGTSSITTTPSPANPLTTKALSASSIRLAWRDVVGETGYRVRTSTDGVNFTQYGGHLASGITSVDIGGLPANTLHYFRVESFNASGAVQSAVVEESTLSAGPLPAPVSGFVRTGQTLSWQPSDNASSYVVEQSSNSGRTWNSYATVTDTTAAVSTTILQGTFGYRVIPRNSFNEEGAASDELFITFNMVSVGAVTATQEAGGRVLVSWPTAPANAVGFRLYKRLAATPNVREEVVDLPAGSKSVIVSDLALGAAVKFEVEAYSQDYTAPAAASSHITPTFVGIDATGSGQATVGESYTLTLAQPGLSGALFWTIDWGDNSAPEKVSLNPAFEQAPRNHTYTDTSVATFTIRVTAQGGGEFYEANPIEVVVGSGTASLMSLSPAQQKAAVLKEFEEVYNNVRLELYSGLKKGHEGTADTKSGNDWDQANLLRERIVEKASIDRDDIKFKFGVIEVPAANILNWVGAKDEAAAERILAAAGVLAMADDDGIWTFATSASGVADGTVHIWHVWLDVQIDGKHYELDPSWKYRDYRVGISEIGSNSATDFDAPDFHDYDGLDLPSRWYASQIQSKYFPSNPRIHLRTSLADVAYDGPIIARKFDTIPSQTEYKLAGGSTALSADSAASVVINGSPVDMRHRVRLTLRDTDGSTDVIKVDLAVPDVGTKLITVEVVRTEDPINPGIVRAKGKLFIGDQEDDSNEFDLPFALSRAMKATVDIFLPGQSLQDIPANKHEVTYNGVRPFALMLAADQFTLASTAGVQERLNYLARRGVPSSLQEYQKHLLGIIGATYARRLRLERNSIAGMMGNVPVTNLVETGLIHGVFQGDLSSNGADYEPSLQNPVVFRSNSGQALASITLAPRREVMKPLWTEANAPGANKPTRQLEAEELLGYTSSALEHAVLQEVTNSLSVSASKVFQKARKDNVNFQLEKIAHNAVGWESDVSVTDAREEIGKDLAKGFDVHLADVEVVISGWRGTAWIRSKSGFQDFRLKRTNSGFTTNGGDATGEVPKVRDPEASQSNFASYGAGTVNLYSGALYYEESDFTIPAPGFPIEFTRRFNSSYRQYDRGFGPGWTFTHSDFLQLTPQDGGNRLSTAASKVLWVTAGGAQYEFIYNTEDRRYEMPAGLYGRLTFNPGRGRVPTRYTYIEKDGTRHTFGVLSSRSGSLDARLLSVQDRLGNGVQLTYHSKRADKVSKINYVNGRNVNGGSSTVDTARYISFGYKYDNTRIESVTDRTNESSVGTKNLRTWNFGYRSLDNEVYILETALEPELIGLERLESVYGYYDSFHYRDGMDTRHGMLHTVQRKVGHVSRSGQYKFDFYANGRVFTITDPSGASEYYSYDQFSGVFDDGVDDDQQGSQVATRVATSVDRNGNESSTFYSDEGLPVRIINPDRSEVQQAWKEYRSVVDPNEPGDDGKQFLLETRTNEVGLIEAFAYDNKQKNGNLLSRITNASYNPATGLLTGGQTTRYTYHDILVSEGKLTVSKMVKETARDGRNRYRYDSAGNMWRASAPVGMQGTSHTDYEYDSNGLQIAVSGANTYLGAALDRFNNTTYYEYDPNGSGQLSRTYQFVDSASDYSLDQTVRQANLSQAKVLKEYSYDRYGYLNTVWDGTYFKDENQANVKRLMRYHFDALGRKRAESIENPDGIADTNDDVRTDYEYWDDLLAVAATRRSNTFSSVSRTWYDPNGRPVLTRELGGEARTSYDAMGNVLGVTDAVGSRSISIYDSRNRKDQTVADDGGSTRTRFDGAGRPVMVLNPQGSPLGYRRLPTADTTTSYGLDGLVANVTDSFGSVTEYIRDTFGAVVEERRYAQSNDFRSRLARNAFARTMNIRIDALGRVLEQRDQAGLMTRTTYDNEGQLTKVARYDVSNVGGFGDRNRNIRASSAKSEQNTTNVYDAAGRLQQTTLSVADALSSTPTAIDITTKSEYDRASRMVRQITPRGASQADAADHSTDFEFDGAGREIKKVMPASPNGSRPVYRKSYYPDGAVRDEWDANGNNTHYSYDYEYRRVVTEYADGSQSNVEMDLAGRVVRQARGGWDDGKVTTMTRDRMGREVETLQPTPTQGTVDGAAPRTSTRYDASGRPYLTVASSGLHTLTRYDVGGRPIETSTFEPTGTQSTWQIEGRFDKQITGGLQLITDGSHGLENGDQVMVLGGSWTERVSRMNRKTLTRTPDQRIYRVHRVDATHFVLKLDTYVADGGATTPATITPFIPALRSPDERIGIIKIKKWMTNTASTYSYTRDGSNGVVATVTSRDARGFLSTTMTDGAGRSTRKLMSDEPNTAPLSVSDEIWAKRYDAYGNVIEEVDDNGNISQNAYDNANRLVRSGRGGRTASEVKASGGVAEITLNRHGFSDGDRIWITRVGVSNSTLENVVGSVRRVDDDKFTIQVSPNVVQTEVTTARVLAGIIDQRYDLSGHLVATVDPLGRQTTYAYDNLGRKHRETQPDPDGSSTRLESREITFDHDANGNLIGSRDDLGRTSAAAYDERNRRIVTGSTGRQAAISGSDESSLLVTLSEHNFESGDRVLLTQSNTNGEPIYGLDGVVSLVQEVTADSFRLHLPSPVTFDNFSTVIVSLATESRGLDGDGNVSWSIDARGVQTEYEYNELGRKYEQRRDRTGNSNALPVSVSTWRYNADGTVHDAISPLGNAGDGRASLFTTTFDYDALGRKISETGHDNDGDASTPARPITRFEYDAAGNVVLSTDPLNHRTSSVYDARGRAIATRSATSDITSLTVNGLNVVATTLLPHKFETGDYVVIDGAAAASNGFNGVFVVTTLGITSFQYQPLVAPTGAPIPTGGKGVSASAAVQRIDFDNNGNVLRSYDSYGHETSSEYDVFDRKLMHTLPDPDGPTRDGGTRGTQAAPTSTFRYDATGNLVSSVDARGMVSAKQYDALNREVVAGAGGRAATLSAVGNLVTVTLNNHGFAKGDQVLLADVAASYEARLKLQKTASIISVTANSFTISLDVAGVSIASGTAAVVLTSVNQTSFDQAGNVFRTVDGVGVTSVRNVDAFGNVVASSATELRGSLDTSGAITLPQGHGVRNGEHLLLASAGVPRGVYRVYDVDGNAVYVDFGGAQWQVLSQDGSDDIDVGLAASQGTYNAMGQSLSTVDALGRVSSTAYDGYNRAWHTTRPAGYGGSVQVEVSFDLEDNVHTSIERGSGYQRTTTFEHDPLNRQIKVTLPVAGVNNLDPAATTTTSYDDGGNVLSVLDATGAKTTYEYDTLGRKRRQLASDPDGLGAADTHAAPETTWAFDPNGNLRRMTTPLGNAQTTSDLVVPTRYTTSYEYDALNRQTRVTTPDPDGGGPKAASASIFGYDAAGNATWAVDPLGTALLGGNPTDAAVAAYVVAGTHATLKEYDSTGRVIRDRQADDGVAATSTPPPLTSFAYDGAGRLITRYDGDPLVSGTNATEYEFDVRGNNVKETITVGTTRHSRRFAYDPVGNVVESEDRNERVKTFNYDDANRLRQERWVLGNTAGNGDRVIYRSFDDLGRLTNVDDGNASYHNFSYDNLDRVVSESVWRYGSGDGVGSSQVHEYDLNSRLISTDLSVNDQFQNRTAYVYDQLGRTAQVWSSSVLPAGNGGSGGQASPALPGVPRQLQFEDYGNRFNQFVEYQYDLDSNITEIIRRGDNEAENGWQLAPPGAGLDGLQFNGAVPIDDGIAQLTEASVSSKGSVFTRRRLSITDSFSTKFSYRATDASQGNDTLPASGGDGITFTIQNDPRGSGAIGQDGGWLGYSGADGSHITNSVAVEIDTFNNAPSSLFNDPDSNHIAIDRDGYLASSPDGTVVVGPATPLTDDVDAPGTTNYVWVEYIAEPDGDGGSLSAWFSKTDGVARPNRSADATLSVDLDQAIGSDWAHFGFTGGRAVARSTQEILTWDIDVIQPAVVTSYQYDESGRQDQIKHVYREPSINGIVETDLASYTGEGGSGGAADRIGLDANGRILDLEHRTTKGETWDDKFTYDDNDQLLTRKRNGVATTDGYAYDERMNRTGGGRVTGDDNRLTNDGTQAIAYDDEGNVTLIGSTGYEYDFNNRLVRVKQGGTTLAEYAYDVSGQRVSKSVPGGTTPVEERYILEGGDTSIVLDDQGQVKARYLRGLRPDEVLSESIATPEGERLTWNLPDHQMSVRDVIGWGGDVPANGAGGTSDAHGVFKDRYDYSAFGVVNDTLTQNALLPAGWRPRFGYTGQEHDAETNLIYMNARYYDAKNARFISRDPIGFEGGLDNLYSYVGNNAPNATDPTGEFVLFAAAAAAIWASVGIGVAARSSESFANSLTNFGGWLSDRTGLSSFTLPLGVMNLSFGKTADGVETFGFGGAYGLTGGVTITNAPGSGGVNVSQHSGVGFSVAGVNVGLTAYEGAGFGAEVNYGFGKAGVRFTPDGRIDPTIGVSVGKEWGNGLGINGGLSYGARSGRVYGDFGGSYYRGNYGGSVTGSASIGSGGVQWEGVSASAGTKPISPYVAIDDWLPQSWLGARQRVTAEQRRAPAASGDAGAQLASSAGLYYSPYPGVLSDQPDPVLAGLFADAMAESRAEAQLQELIASNPQLSTVKNEVVNGTNIQMTPRQTLAVVLGYLGNASAEEVEQQTKYVADHQAALRRLGTGGRGEAVRADHRARLAINQQQLAEALTTRDSLPGLFDQLGLGATPIVYRQPSGSVIGRYADGLGYEGALAAGSVALHPAYVGGIRSTGDEVLGLTTLLTWGGSNSIVSSLQRASVLRPTAPVTRVTQYFDPTKGEFPIGGRYALSAKPTPGNRLLDGITTETTWVAPRPAGEMSQWRRFWTGVGNRRNYVEFDVFPGELQGPGGFKTLYSGFQQTIPGKIDLLTRNPTFGVSSFNYVDVGLRYGVPTGLSGMGGYYVYRQVNDAP